MKKLFFTVMAVVAAAGCANDTAKYVIKGSAPQDGTVVFLTDEAASRHIDSAVVSNGVFEMQGKAAKDAFLSLTYEDSDFTFPFINDGEPVQVAFAERTLTGSDLNNRLSECDRKADEAYAEFNAFVMNLMSLPEEEQEAKMPEYRAAYEKLSECYLGVIDENKDNLIPLAFLKIIPSLAGEEKFNELMTSDAAFTKHPFAVELKRKFDESNARQKEAEEKKLAFIGQKFTDLEEADPEGNLHKLSEFVGKGKWVLVDFWASWCGPCKAEMPNVVAAYKNYHAKGFDIVGLSFDREKDPWVKAIAEWEMPWIHLSDLKYWQSVASDVYGVNSIPDNLLIDPEGTIVARGLRGADLEAKLAEVIQ